MLASVRFIRTHAAAPSTIGHTKRAWARGGPPPHAAPLAMRA
jgi:hypothetical protein